MKRLNILFVFILFSFFCGTVCAQRFALPVKEEKNSREFVEHLKNHRLKLNHLLSMRKKVDSWEKRLMVMDSRLYSEQKKQIADLQLVKSGKLPEVNYKTKWEVSGRQAKTLIGVKTFRAEIEKYNKYRLGYNNLAKELAKHLQHREPVDVKKLVRKMEQLIGVLQQAINSENFVKANTIAKNSNLATEFGYPLKK